MTDYQHSPTFIEEWERLWGAKSDNLPIRLLGGHAAPLARFGSGGGDATGVWDWQNHQAQAPRLAPLGTSYLMFGHGKDDRTIDWTTQGRPLVAALTAPGCRSAPWHEPTTSTPGWGSTAPTTTRSAAATATWATSCWTGAAAGGRCRVGQRSAGPHRRRHAVLQRGHLVGHRGQCPRRRAGRPRRQVRAHIDEHLGRGPDRRCHTATGGPGGVRRLRLAMAGHRREHRRTAWRRRCRGGAGRHGEDVGRAHPHGHGTRLELAATAGGASPTALDWFPTTTDGRVHAFSDQLPMNELDDARVAFAAHNYVGSQKLTATEIARVRAVNPGFALLHYRLGTASGPLPYIFGGTWGSDWPAVDGHEDWFEHNAVGGARLLQEQNQWYLHDITQSAFQSYWIDSTIADMRATGAQGTFADSFTAGIWGGLLGQATGDPGSTAPELSPGPGSALPGWIGWRPGPGASARPTQPPRGFPVRPERRQPHDVVEHAGPVRRGRRHARGLRPGRTGLRGRRSRVRRRDGTGVGAVGGGQAADPADRADRRPSPGVPVGLVLPAAGSAHLLERDLRRLPRHVLVARSTPWTWASRWLRSAH